MAPKALLPNPASVLASIGADGGGYVDLDGDGNWWIPSGRAYYIDTPPAVPSGVELQAMQHFFLSRRFEDPFGNAAMVDYDSNDLLPVETDGCRRATWLQVSNDYRVLAPALMTDANGNQAAASFDTLGLVAGTAVMGKPGQNLGDLLTGFSADLPQSQDRQLLRCRRSPHGSRRSAFAKCDDARRLRRESLLQQPNRKPADPTKWMPCFAATISRETHYYDLAAGQQSRLQISFSYSDGFGREIQKKIQAEPGPASGELRRLRAGSAADGRSSTTRQSRSGSTSRFSANCPKGINSNSACKSA